MRIPAPGAFSSLTLPTSTPPVTVTELNGQATPGGLAGLGSLPGVAGNPYATTAANLLNDALSGAQGADPTNLSGVGSATDASGRAGGALSGGVGGLSSVGSGGPGFGQTMQNAVDQVNTLQNNADQLAQKLATGDVEDVHQVMLALNQASNAFGVTVQVRNKALDAYQEIMRMQV